jgi:hypothetical protein
MITSQDREIQGLVQDIRDGKLLLPELQRGYVWKSSQVRALFDSLYQGYPSGQLLIWETDDLPYARTVSVDNVQAQQWQPQLLLDGQQRLTSLSAIMLGRELRVQDNTRPIDIVFNIHTEQFAVAGPRQSGEIGWISLARLFTLDQIDILREINLSFSDPEASQILERLKRLENIRTYKYRVNVLDKLSYEEVTDIFIRINSGGTVLSNADLALAQISSRWRGVTEAIDLYQQQVKKRYYLSIDTSSLLRTLSLFLTGQSSLSYFFRGDRRKIGVAELQAGWKRVTRSMDQALIFLSQNCRIERLWMLPTNYISVTLAGFFDRFGDSIDEKRIRDLQRWVYMALVWSRYSNASETALDQDYTALGKEDPVASMIQSIEDKSGRRQVSERELRDQRKNSPFMVMNYVLARYADAQDWFTGVSIGGSQTLEFHHIFPKAVLRNRYQLRKHSRTVDQVANLVFLSRRANLKIGSQSPGDYLSKLEANRLRAQYIPQDAALWTLDQFEEFALQRRQLLADGINKLLATLSDAPALHPISDVALLEERIEGLEHQLRDLVADRLIEARGDGALEHCVPQNTRKGILHRLQQRLHKNPFEAEDFSSLNQLLQFCQFSDYAKIMRDNWALFSDTFGDGKSFDQHIAAVTTARNAFAHNNPIGKADILLAEGGLIWVEECLRSLAQSEAEELDEEEEEESVA